MAFGGFTEIDSQILTAGAERGLYDTYQAMRGRVKELEEAGEYEAGFRALASLRPQVDLFFDTLLVMDEDRRIRANRLRLLSELRAHVFSRFADLSQIESTSSNIGDASA